MLYERYAKRRFEEGKQEGLRKGWEGARDERDKEWMAWLKCRDEALTAGEEFDEPPPSAKAMSKGLRYVSS